MRFILQMTLSGSTMWILYLAVKYSVGRKISNRVKYLMLKAAVLFYLVPLAALNHFLVKHVDIVRKVLWKNDSKISFFGSDTKVLYYTGNGLVLSGGIRIEIIIAAVWGIAVLVLLIYKGIKHFRWVKSLGRLTELSSATETEVDLDLIKKKYKLMRRIEVCRNQSGARQAFTLGCIRPLIFCMGDMSKEEKELVYSHEVVHIKRWDVFWKVLMECACLAHWFNPFVRFLRKEMEFISEEVCDDAVLRGKGKRERELYASLLLEFAKEKPVQKGWSIALSKKSKRLKERMENAMQEKTGKRLAQLVSLGIVVAAVTVNSLTALAYGMIPEVNVTKSEDDSGHWEIGEGYFATYDVTAQDFEEAGIEVWGITGFEFTYDFEFVDESGNVYPVEEQDVAVYDACKHQYVSGTYTKHVKDANGGCTVTLYEALRCSLCGNVVTGEIINQTYSRTCIH